MSAGLQAALVVVAVASAAGWTLWSVVLPRRVKTAIRRKLGRADKDGCERCGRD